MREYAGIVEVESASFGALRDYGLGEIPDPWDFDDLADFIRAEAGYPHPIVRGVRFVGDDGARAYTVQRAYTNCGMTWVDLGGDVGPLPLIDFQRRFGKGEFAAWLPPSPMFNNDFDIQACQYMETGDLSKCPSCPQYPICDERFSHPEITAVEAAQGDRSSWYSAEKREQWKAIRAHLCQRFEGGIVPSVSVDMLAELAENMVALGTCSEDRLGAVHDFLDAVNHEILRLQHPDLVPPERSAYVMVGNDKVTAGTTITQVGAAVYAPLVVTAFEGENPVVVCMESLSRRPVRRWTLSEFAAQVQSGEWAYLDEVERVLP